MAAAPIATYPAFYFENLSQNGATVSTTHDGDLAAQLHQALEPALLAVRQLQALRQSNRVVGTGDQGRQARQLPTTRPLEHQSPVAVVLQPRIQQNQPPPGVKVSQGHSPRLALQQQLQFHPQPGAKSWRHLLRRRPWLPGPGPRLEHKAHLLIRTRIQLKTKPSGISGSPNQARGILQQAVGMQQAQPARRKILLAVIGIEQLNCIGSISQQQSNGVHAEIAPVQIVIEAAERHAWVIGGNRVDLLPSRGHVQQPGFTIRQSQLHFHGAKAAVFTKRAAAARGQLAGKALHQIHRPAFHNQVEIGQPSPRIAVTMMQQQIPHRTTHQRQAAACGRMHQCGDQRGGDAWNLHQRSVRRQRATRQLNA